MKQSAPLIFLIIVISFILSACTVSPQISSTGINTNAAIIPLPDSQKNPEQNHYWWYARFRMHWDKQEESLDFSSNLIIAHQIINPILLKHRQAVKLWRFHRRAADDTASHQFSFIFYSTADSARTIFEQIKTAPLSKQLLRADIIEQIILDDPDTPSRPDIEDTSDSHWDIAIQKSWPYYIMGVSILWLDLLNQQAISDKLDTHQPLEVQMQHYKQINENLSEQWRTQAKHAYFHHISGIFGYEPIEVRY